MKLNVERVRVQERFSFLSSGIVLDLVKCMICIAMDDFATLFPQERNEMLVIGASIESRLYARSLLQGFQPSSGKLLNVEFMPDVCVDNWSRFGSKVLLGF